MRLRTHLHRFSASGTIAPPQFSEGPSPIAGSRQPRRRARSTADPHQAERFDYDTIPPGYYDTVYRRGAGIQSKWHHLKFDRVLSEMDGCRRHLDVGCGPGTLIGLLDEQVSSTGVDVSSSQIAYARRHYESASKRFYTPSVEALPDDCHDYDVATIVEVVEHLQPTELDDLLQATIERQRSGGKLIVTTPNFHSAWPVVQWCVNRFGELDYAPQHLNCFTSDRLRHLLEELGLKEVTVRSFLALAPFTAPLGWTRADSVARLERASLERFSGLLLLGTAIKP